MPSLALSRVLLVSLVAALSGGHVARAASLPSPSPASEPATRPPAPDEGETVLYGFEDEARLMPWQKRGAAAFVPPAVGTSQAVPLLVFLHGTNPDATLHLWMGGGGKDLRPTLREAAASSDARFVLAAPSQTRAASSGRGLWTRFDLQRFVTATRLALASRAKIDPSRVFVLGHSGAGCNPDGGVVSAARGSLVPAGVVAIDTCLDAEMGAAMGRRPASVKLWALWQGASWPREPEAFRQAVEGSQPSGAWFRMEQRPAGIGNPHDAIVPDALKVLLGAWVTG